MKNLFLIIALSFISFVSFSQNAKIEICQNSHNTFIYQNGEKSTPLFEIRKSNYDGDIGHIELRRADSYAVYLIIKQVDRDGRFDIVNADMIKHIDKILG